MKNKRKGLLLLLAALLSGPIVARSQGNLKYRVEATGTAADGKYAPLWFTANRFGIQGVDDKQVSLRAGLFYKQSLGKKWSLEAGMDLAGGVKLASDFWVHQAYMDVAWKALQLSVGCKERAGFPLDKDMQLSSGWLVEGMNTRPVPQVRIEVPNYWSVPGLRGWLALKGHLAYGWFIDDKWKEEFVTPDNLYMKKILYHSKSLMFRVGNREKFPVELEWGLLMANQFGGDQYTMHEDGKGTLNFSMPKGFEAYWKAFYPQSSEPYVPVVGEVINIEGNVLGSWNFALTGYAGDWKLRTYYEHLFEDHSQMGWKYGRWKDGQLGFEVTPPKNRWVKTVVWEMMATKDQSGPFESHSEYWPGVDFERLGCDNYYNHYIYQSWQYFGMGMGHPLLPGPAYNADGSLIFRSNRVRGHHLGIAGVPSPEWNWRVLASFVRHWGTYEKPLDRQRKQFSGMLEVCYLPKWASGWKVSAAFGLDKGNFMGNSCGGMLSLCKVGGFNL